MSFQSSRGGAGLLHRGGFITAAANERNGALLCRLEFNREADPLPAVAGLKYAEMQMRSARETRVAGMRNDFAGGHSLAGSNEAAIFLKMAVMTEGSIIMPDKHVIIVAIELHTSPTGIGIIFDPDDDAGPSG